MLIVVSDVSDPLILDHFGQMYWICLKKAMSIQTHKTLALIKEWEFINLHFSGSALTPSPSPNLGERSKSPVPLLPIWEKGLGDEGRSKPSKSCRLFNSRS
jgi:hypothetical protein